MLGGNDLKSNTEGSLRTTTKDYPPGVRGPHRWQEAHWVLIPAGTSHQSPLHFADQLGGGGGVGKELSARVVVGICCSDKKLLKPPAYRPCPHPNFQGFLLPHLQIGTGLRHIGAPGCLVTNFVTNLVINLVIHRIL